jgi:hypothetical protein
MQDAGDASQVMPVSPQFFCTSQKDRESRRQHATECTAKRSLGRRFEVSTTRHVYQDSSATVTRTRLALIFLASYDTRLAIFSIDIAIIHS